MVRWFLQASDDSPTLRGGAIAQGLLRLVAGNSLVSTLTEFLSEMAFLREGFADRAREVRDVMRSSSTTFVLVSSADPLGLDAARAVTAELTTRDFSMGCVVFNRAFIPEVDLAADGPPSYPESLAAIAPKIDRLWSHLAQEEAQKHSEAVAFCQEHGLRGWSLPESTRPLGDTSALAAWIDTGRKVGSLT